MRLLIFILFTPSILALTVLIDPGHGGHDHGAKSHLISSKKSIEIKEKDLALTISNKIHALLKKKGINVYLTRSIDRVVSLEERAELADKIKADLFISVHINSSKSRKAHGFETYYLDNHKDDVVKKIEAIENKNLKGEEFVINNILTDLVIERTAPSSKKLAKSIHDQIGRKVGKRYKMKDRGIRPGLFYVLALTKRPGVLLEVGFLSNNRELSKMLGRRFQDRYAKAAAQGILNYIKAQKKSTPILF